MQNDRARSAVLTKGRCVRVSGMGARTVSAAAAKGPAAAAAPEPVAKTGFSSFDLLDGDIPPMVGQAPLFGAAPLAPTSTGSAAAPEAAAPAAPAPAAAPAVAAPVTAAAVAVAAAAAPVPGGLTRTDSTASAKDLAKEPPKGKEKAEKAPKEKLGLFGTLIGRKKKEKGYAAPWTHSAHRPHSAHHTHAAHQTRPAHSKPNPDPDPIR